MFHFSVFSVTRVFFFLGLSFLRFGNMSCSLRAGVGSATARSSSSRMASKATLLRAFSSRRQTPLTLMSTPTPIRRRPFAFVAIASSGSDEGAQSEGFSPSTPQTTSEERRRSGGSGAVRFGREEKMKQKRRRFRCFWRRSCSGSLRLSQPLPLSKI